MADIVVMMVIRVMAYVHPLGDDSRVCGLLGRPRIAHVLDDAEYNAAYNEREHKEKQNRKDIKHLIEARITEGWTRIVHGDDLL